MTTDEIVLEIEKINSLTVFGYLLFGFQMLERLQKEVDTDISFMIYDLEERAIING